jgi:serine/threonine protein kinase
VQKRDIEDEAQAVKQLLSFGQHPNVVSILKDGWLLPTADFYFIDMELCDGTLHDYIHDARSESLVSTADSTYVSRASTILVKMRNLWTILMQLANGLEYLHKHKLVHRDLKPKNGICLQKPRNTDLKSSLLETSDSMENF